MLKDIDSFIEWNNHGDFLIEETLTPSLPKDETIYELNNISKDFSSLGIEERNEICLEQRK